MKKFSKGDFVACGYNQIFVVKEYVRENLYHCYFGLLGSGLRLFESRYFAYRVATQSEIILLKQELKQQGYCWDSNNFKLCKINDEV